MLIDFQTSPDKYRHWRIQFDGDVANLVMDVDEDAGLFEGYQLKLNSYDLGVDIELYDALQRIRFEHPEVKTVILSSGKDRVFCAGANIRMLAGSSHGHKVNFCKFTNETRNSIEDASRHSGLKFIAAVKGSCAGGGYELALACDYILLTDDGSSSVSLPEVPLLAVLPGTGGLTRITDKRKLRRDRADMFCCIEEGIKGAKAVDWRLVDAIAVNSEFEQKLTELAGDFASQSIRNAENRGIELGPLQRRITEDKVMYSSVELEIDRDTRVASLSINAPTETVPASIDAFIEQGDQNWAIRAARELDDAILHLRLNETEIGIIQFRARGDASYMLALDDFLIKHQQHWLAREILLNWTRVLKRIDLTSRSLIALVEPGSCFAGTLAEIAFSCDRIFMADGIFEDMPDDEARLVLSEVSFGHYPMSNGLTRLQTRLPGEAELLLEIEAKIAAPLNAENADKLGLISHAYDDIDWYDEIRIFTEERSSFSADAMTAMEANLRFGGPETMETKIFGRLTAWQNWVFQRPNAVGEAGALRRYGSGKKGEFDQHRV